MLFWVLVAPRNGVSYSLHPDVEGGNHGPSDEAFLDTHVHGRSFMIHLMEMQAQGQRTGFL